MEIKLLYTHDINILEDTYFSFHIKDISRLCLIELTRHREASYSVKSTRYTTKKELKNEPIILSLIKTDDPLVKEVADKYLNIPEALPEEYRLKLIELLGYVQKAVLEDIPVDVAKYLNPESLKTELIMTINYKSLQNLFDLRMAPGAHFEIREMANKIYTSLPDKFKETFKIEWGEKL